MEIKVNDQLQRFYLAYGKGWIEAVGHEIKVGKYRFSAVPTEGRIIVSELTTGMKFRDFTVTPLMLMAFDKDDTINHLMTIGETIKETINETDNFDKYIEDGKKFTEEFLGEKPKTENADMEKITNEYKKRGGIDGKIRSY